MEASDIKIIKDLEDENHRLIAALSHEKRALKDVIEPTSKRELIAYLITTFGLSILQACRGLYLSRYGARIPLAMNLLFPH